MDNSTYLKQSETTERKFPEGLVVGMNQFGIAVGDIDEIVALANFIGDAKKHIIYGKDAPEVIDYPVFLDQPRAEVFHALLGIITESGEIAETLLADIRNPEKGFDVVNLNEEIGDLFWYVAILQRLFDLDLGVIYDTNIAKLKARFPDKFDADKALNRNKEAELARMEALLKFERSRDLESELQQSIADLEGGQA